MNRRDLLIRSAVFISGATIAPSLLSGQTSFPLYQKAVERSNLDKLKTRRLLSKIEEALQTAVKSNLMEINDDYLKEKMTIQISEYLEVFREHNLLNGFKVFINRENNSEEDRNAGRLNIDIYYTPSMTTGMIQIKSTVTRTTVGFDEFIGNAELV